MAWDLHSYVGSWAQVTCLNEGELVWQLRKQRNR
jgi:hypothetical protein